MNRLWVGVCCLVTSLAVGATKPMVYPESKRGTVADTYFGTAVADPYRWLEDLDSPETRAWVAAQNQLTFDFLKTLPQRDTLKQRLLALNDYPRYSLPNKEGGRYFYTHNTGLQNQAPLYVKDALSAEGRLLLDPNAWSKAGTVSLNSSEPSPDGRWLAYGTAAAGSDWVEVSVCAVEAGAKNACPGDRSEANAVDRLKWIKFTGVSWTKDNAGFFYSRFPTPGASGASGAPGSAGGNATGAKGDATFGELAYQKIYYHRLGTTQADDVLVFESPDFPQRGWEGTVTDDGRYLLILGEEGTDERNRLYCVDLQDPLKPAVTAPVVKIVDTMEASYQPVGNAGSVLFVETDLEAPRQRVIAIDLTAPQKKNWQTLIPESRDVMRSAGVIGGRFVVHYMQDAKSRLSVFALDGAPQGDIKLPGIGTVGGISGKPQDADFFYSFSSFADPGANYRADVATRKVEVFQAPKVAFDASRYETRQVFYPSKDGTRIPLFITLRKGMKLDGSHPVLLHAYGGFNSPQTPGFSTATVVWLEQGGIYALANLRGGGEYGREWHLAGTKERKQNVFDDFAAAGDWLVAQGYTTHARLTISGRSNGGLLIGAVVNQRPDLARVALPGVGVMDMLRFQKFTIGWAWTSDYGSSDDKDGFGYLYPYSPVHNVKSGVRYPAVLVTTGDHDDRVHPGHSFKYTAALQAANKGGEYPALIRIETDAGHGAGKPLSKQIEETADKFAFALHFTGEHVCPCKK